MGKMLALLDKMSDLDKIEIASDPTTDSGVLDYLAESDCSSSMVRCCVAANPNSPAETLKELFEMYDGLESILAANPSCPQELMVQLDEAEDTGIVPIKLVYNPSVPYWLLIHMFEYAREKDLRHYSRKMCIKKYPEKWLQYRKEQYYYDR